MNQTERSDLLRLLKAVGQEQRLTMVGMMSARAHTVSEMAEALDLTEPTVSHHVSRLREAGLLQLRMDGNQRFYSLNQKRVNALKKYTQAIDTLPAEPKADAVDNSWIEALPWDAEAKKVLYTYTSNGHLQQIPSKEKKLLVILRWLATLFDPGRRYSEKEVNQVLSGVHPDYASLRRYLISYGYMQRQRGGGDYWLAPEDAGPA